MKKIIFNVFLIISIMFLLLSSGCAKDDNQETNTVTQEQSQDEKISQNKSDSSKMQRVGSEGIGYVSVPSTWLKFEDVEGGDDIQYSDPSGISIITLNIFDTSGLDEENAKNFNAEFASKNVWINIENSQEPENIEAAKVKLNDRDAYQVYASYDDESMLVTWCVEDDNGVIHYVAAEGTNETIMDIVSFVEESYSFEK